MKLGQVIPALRIFDEKKAREFYVEFLGFKVDWEHRFQEDFPIYMQISRDDTAMHLSEHHGDGCPGAFIMIVVDDVKAYQKELIAKKYKYARPGYEETDWDTIEMKIADPFGNKLSFFQNLEKKSS
ncbi:MAG: glyoxalase superfamily protein [Planctomycetota bacterium]|nr:glyoxalase superfamily protein [Planctomycetota bacterium]